MNIIKHFHQPSTFDDGLYVHYCCFCPLFKSVAGGSCEGERHGRDSLIQRGKASACLRLCTCVDGGCG